MVIGWAGLQSVEKVWAAQTGIAAMESAKTTKDFLAFERKGRVSSDWIQVNAGEILTRVPCDERLTV
jgi:hypothetical protein